MFAKISIVSKTSEDWKEICTMADLPNKQEFALKHAEAQ